MSILTPPFPTPILRGGHDRPAEASYQATMTPGQEHTLLEVTKAAVVDVLILAGAHSNIQIEIAHKPAVGSIQLATQIGANLGHVTWVSLDLIRQGHSAEMQIVKWYDPLDGVNPQFVACLRAPLHWPYGGRIRIKNGAGGSRVASAKAAYRLLEP